MNGTDDLGSAKARAIRERVTRVSRIVVKVGSGVLTGGAARVDIDHMAHLAEEIGRMRAGDPRRDVVLVSSGAVATGLERLGYAVRKPGLAAKQAAAAVGQPHLMGRWERAFAPSKIAVAQVLLTHADLASRRRFLNARHTFNELLAEDVLPIVNENDTVSVEEIQFGDNDRLAALVTSVVEADLLVLLTDVDGLFDRDPKQPGAERVPLVENVSEDTLRAAGGAGSAVGTGGMRSKVDAARTAALSGVPTIIANGRTRGSLTRVFAAEDVGTLFLPRPSPLPLRKHWIAYTLKPLGVLVVDAGASRALRSGGKSLLPAGIVEVQGEFDVGDPVSVVGTDGREIARGLASYGARELERIRGLASSEIERVLGYRYDDEAIHRDDLVLLDADVS
jgi:glutamate 5-kinase